MKGFRGTRPPTFAPLTDEQVADLIDFSIEHGPMWKSMLATAWTRGSAPASLHALRNSHGTEWLRDYGATFVAFYPHAWGKGSTVDEAKANARKEGGRGEYRVVRMPDGASDVSVDAMGRLSWQGPPGEPTLVASGGRKAVRR